MIRRGVSQKILIAVLSIAIAVPLFAQHDEMSAKPSGNGFQADWWASVADAQHKLVDLAKAMPEEKYSWRPMEGVRSVSEVFVHVAMANYMISGALGFEPPADLTKDAEKTVTKKADVIALLERSFDDLSKIDTSKMNLDATIKLFGSDMSKRRVLLLLSSHCHEHLGQSIAYARMNHVVPPWSK